MNKFNKWLDTFIEEKELDIYEQYQIEGPSGLNFINNEVVIDFIKNLDTQNQEKIKNKIVLIDMRSGRNSDINNFFKYIATAIAK